MDDVRIYNRALEGSEINQIHNEAFVSSSLMAKQDQTVTFESLQLMGGESNGDSFLSQTIYEDAEDGSIAGWQPYGDGSVVNLEDTSGNRIISTETTLGGDPFRLGLEDESDWNNSEEFTAYFAILMEKEEAAVYFRVETSEGEKFLCYRSGTESIDISDSLLCFGLGIEADGQWHAITLDLASDLDQAMPNTTLISIKDFYVFGSVKLDDLMLVKKRKYSGR